MFSGVSLTTSFQALGWCRC